MIQTPALHVLWILLLAASSASHAAAPGYEVTELRALDGFGTARALTDKGWVAGYAAVPGEDELMHAFLWRDTETTIIGTAGFEESRAFGVNESGQVTGELFSVGRAPRAFLYTGGKVTELPPLGKGLYPTAQRSTAYDINDRGMVAGVAEDPDGLLRPVVWEKGAVKALESASGAAYAINEAGQVAGSITTSSGDRACIWYDGKRTDVGGKDESSVAGAINKAGEVAGVRVLPGQKMPPATRAFLWSNGRMRDLGVLAGDAQSEATDLNDRGVVVGFSRHSVKRGDSERWITRAFLWRGGAMYDLNTLLPPGSPWTLTQAWGINNIGQIVGEGLLRGKPRAFLLTPLPDAPGKPAAKKS